MAREEKRRPIKVRPVSTPLDPFHFRGPVPIFSGAVPVIRVRGGKVGWVRYKAEGGAGLGCGPPGGRHVSELRRPEDGPQQPPAGEGREVGRCQPLGRRPVHHASPGGGHRTAVLLGGPAAQSGGPPAAAWWPLLCLLTASRTRGADTRGADIIVTRGAPGPVSGARGFLAAK